MRKQVLVATRGAIAVCICRTLDALDVGSVAVFAQADRDALHHVEAARQAVSLGSGGGAETYMSQAKLLDAVAQRGAGAVHPGYGFLSENPDFAHALKVR